MTWRTTPAPSYTCEDCGETGLSALAYMLHCDPAAPGPAD